jgi:hypothetical protein
MWPGRPDVGCASGVEDGCEVAGGEPAGERGQPECLVHPGVAGDASNPSGDLASAWVAKELFRNMYASKDRRAAHRALIRFYTHCAERHHAPELVTLAGTVSA